MIVFYAWNYVKKNVSSRIPSKPVNYAKPKDTRPNVDVSGGSTKELFTNPEDTVKEAPVKDADVKESFSTGRNVSFPSYNGPVLRFNLRSQHPAYTEYAENELYVTQEIKDKIASLPIADPELPAYGAIIGTFDSDIVSIPWDYDNMSYIQSDILWGVVSPEASKSIFLKSYNRAILSDPTNVNIDSNGMRYLSPILGITTTDPATSIALQVFDQTAAAQGSRLLPASKNAEQIYDDIKMLRTRIKIQNGTASLTEMADYKANSLLQADILKNQALEKEIKARQGRIAIGAASADDIAKQAQANLLKENALKADIIQEKLDATANQARLDKIASGKVLTAAEQAEHVKYSTKLSKITLVSKVAKELKKFSLITKMLAGKKFAKAFLNGIKDAVKKVFIEVGEKIAKFALKKGAISGVVNTLMALGVGALIGTKGGSAQISIILIGLGIAWNILDIVCTAVMLGLSVLLPLILDKGYADGAVCETGKPFDQIISDDFLYFIVTTFIPIGGILDAYGPYVCYTDDGGSHMKTPLRIPSYFSDSTLSIYRHAYTNAETPRGDSTTYKGGADDVPAGWKYTAGIMRQDCEPNTWTTSDVDMLCNISTYIPNPTLRNTSIRHVKVKDTEIPSTYPKGTTLLTYGRGIGVGLGHTNGGGVPMQTKCPPGQKGDFTGGCWVPY